MQPCDGFNPPSKIIGCLLEKRVLALFFDGFGNLEVPIAFIWWSHGVGYWHILKEKVTCRNLLLERLPAFQLLKLSLHVWIWEKNP